MNGQPVRQPRGLCFHDPACLEHDLRGELPWAREAEIELIHSPSRAAAHVGHYRPP